MAIATTDGMPIRYYYISPISSTANSITLTIKADSVSGSINNAQVFVNLDTYFNNYYVDFSTLFTELGADWSILYITDGGTSIPVKVEKWDEVNNKARLWVTIPVLTSASKDIVLEFDNTVVTPNDLITDMTVSGMIIPTPDPTDLFLYYPIDDDFYNIIEDSTGSYLITTEYYYDFSLYTMEDGSQFIGKCAGDDTRYYQLNKTSTNYVFTDNNAWGYASTANLTNCTYVEGNELIIDTCATLFTAPESDKYDMYYPTSIVNDYGRNAILCSMIEPIWSNELRILRSLDGINWTSVYMISTTPATYEVNYITLLPNSKASVGGFLHAVMPFPYPSDDYYYVRTSNADGTVWTQRSKPLRYIDSVQFNYYGVGDYDRTIYSLVYGDKVISQISRDSDNEIFVTVFSSYGGVFDHHIVPPLAPGWELDSTWYGPTGHDTHNYNRFCVYDTGTEEILFGIFGNDSELDSPSKLFKSNDWGLTWSLVDNLQPLRYYSYWMWDESSEGNPSISQATMSMNMICNDTYLTILATNIGAQVEDGIWDSSNGGVFQFKLSDIIMVELDSLTNTALQDPNDIAISGTVAYVVTIATPSAITSIDISDPSNIAPLDVLSGGALDWSRAIAISGDVAYVVSSSGDSITAINISDPSNLSQRSTLSSLDLEQAYDIKISGTVAFVLSYRDYLFTSVDISDPDNMSILQAYSTSPDAIYESWHFDIEGTKAVIASHINHKIVVIDITDPENMSTLGSYTSATNMENPRAIAVKDNVAYVSTSFDNSIIALDISTPSSIYELDLYVNADAVDNVKGMEISGNILYCASYDDDSITALDISDPTDIKLLQTLTSLNMNGAIDLSIGADCICVVAQSGDSITSISKL